MIKDTRNTRFIDDGQHAAGVLGWYEEQLHKDASTHTDTQQDPTSTEYEFTCTHHSTYYFEIIPDAKQKNKWDRKCKHNPWDN